jgi:hypothetical protein
LKLIFSKYKIFIKNIFFGKKRKRKEKEKEKKRKEFDWNIWE